MHILFTSTDSNCSSIIIKNLNLLWLIKTCKRSAITNERLLIETLCSEISHFSKQSILICAIWPMKPLHCIFSVVLLPCFEIIYCSFQCFFKEKIQRYKLRLLFHEIKHLFDEIIWENVFWNKWSHISFAEVKNE